jgi:subtilase family serine protease
MLKRSLSKLVKVVKIVKNAKIVMTVKIAASTLSLLVSVALPLSAQNRVPQLIPAGSVRVAIANTINPRVRQSTDLGEANANQPLSLSLRFNMTTAQTTALQQFLVDQQNPSSPRYHQALTPQQFGAQFGLSTSDLASITSWLQTQGFTVTGIANGRTFITFTGTIAQANQAFGVTLHSLTFNGEQHIGNLTDPTLPLAIAQVTTGITGLNDFRFKSRAKRRLVPAEAKFNGAAAGYGNLVAPGDFFTIYDEGKLLTASTPINGTGVTIGVLGQVSVYPADVANFRTASGLSSTNPFTQDAVNTTPAAPTAVACNAANPPSSCDDLYESSLDLEWSGASAPGATILFVTGQDVFADAMTQAIDKNLAPILTVSYGDCEANFNYGSITTQSLNTLFMQAAAQMQTILGPAGDSGATDCDYNESVATQGLAVDYPASSPYVTAVGGTQFAENGGTYWNTTNGTSAGSALSYIPEQPWNEFYQTFSGTVAGLDDGGGGGGISQLFSKPYWQQGSGVPADASRDVPDVSFNGAANHDGYLVCVFSSCTNGGFSFTSGGAVNYEVVGGTSVSTPLFAGTLALVEQKTAAKIGLANPTIYGLANSSYLNTVFHDKTTGGNNAAPCTEGTPDCNPGFPNFYAAGTLTCPANSCSGDIAFPAIGYAAGNGYVYDTATGWGSVDIANFVTDWSLATPIAAPATAADNASAVTVASTTPSIAVGGTITVTATVKSAASSVTTAPTGTVTLLIDNVVEGTAVPLAGGTATLTYATPSTFASGTHTVSVSYSGDAVYAGAKGATSVDVTSATAQDFSLTPATTAITVASGGTTTPITYTVTSLNSFSGAVTFSASTTDTTLNNDAAISFTVDPVSVTATTPGTTAFTLYAYYNANTGLFKQGKLQRLGASGSAHNAPTLNPWALAGTGAAFAGLLLFGLPRKRRNRWSAVLVAVCTVAILSVAGCTGSTASAGGSNGNINVPAGTYPVTITATGTTSAGVSISHSAAITLTVQ